MATAAAQFASFVVNLSANYLLSRLSARDGPRLGNLEAASGDYGVPLPRGLGSAVRLTGVFMGQSDIDEDKHKVSDHSTIVGAVGGAVQGAIYGGPVGAVVGAVVGGLFGAATPNQYYYTYSVPALALLLLDRAPAGKGPPQDPIEGVQKLWAGGKVIFTTSQSTVVDEAFDADGRLIWRKYKKNKYMAGLTVYTGHPDQPVDPVLAGQQEIAEDGGYPFSAYAMLDDLQLAAFGNSIPTIEALTLVKSGETLADGAEWICAAAGIDPEREMSSTALTGDAIRGYSITSETNCWDALKPLMPVYAADCADMSGQVRFYKRSQSMRATIPPDDMGAHIYGDSPPERFMFRRGSDLDLPRETSLTFIDPSRDYQPNTATSRRSEGNAASNVSVSLQLVLEASEGASAAALMHWDAWLGRTALSFSLMDSWSPEAGAAYAIAVAGNYVPYRFTRALTGANGIIEVEALSDESVTYTASVAHTSGALPPDEDTNFADTRLILIDGAITEDGHDDYGFYVVMAGSAGGWTRGRIEVSGDGGATFVTIIDSPIECPAMGDVSGVLAAGPTDGFDDTLDTVSVLTVVLAHDLMVLDSATDAELDAWANFAFVGKDGQGEYLQYKTATKVDVATWELTDLRRGRRGTDWAIAGHGADEEFALLGEGGVFRIVYSDTSSWGDPLTFRGVTLHQDAEDAAEVAFTNTGEGKRPFSPINIEGVWDGSNNLTATFELRPRLFSGALGIDDNEEWEIEITNAVPVRTITVTTESFDYSAADQTADGLVPERVIEGRIRQTSDVNDGRWREFVLIGPAATLLELEDGTTPFSLEAGLSLIEMES